MARGKSWRGCLLKCLLGARSSLLSQVSRGDWFFVLSHSCTVVQYTLGSAYYFLYFPRLRDDIWHCTRFSDGNCGDYWSRTRTNGQARSGEECPQGNGLRPRGHQSEHSAASVRCQPGASTPQRARSSHFLGRALCHSCPHRNIGPSLASPAYLCFERLLDLVYGLGQGWLRLLGLGDQDVGSLGDE